MRYRHFLFLGLVGAAGLLGACFDGDDDDDNGPDAAAPADAAPSSDGGSPTNDATVPDGGTKPTDGGAATDAGDAGDASIFTHNDGGPLTIPARCNGAISSPNVPASPMPPSPPSLGLADGFSFETVGTVADGPRQLVVLPNGDMLVATNGSKVYLITNADGAPGTVASSPTVFATFPDSPAQGIAYDPTSCIIYVGTQHYIYAMAYVDAQTTGVVGAPIASFRQVAPDAGHDDDIHTTTSLAVVPGGYLYAAIGSDCNACTEVDPTRATIQQMNLDGTNMVTKATRVRNAIAMAVNPNSGAVWAGGAGQDDLPSGHPLEWFDNVTSHTGEADYGWPVCEENHVSYGPPGTDCSGVVIPQIEMPAYQTLIGAVFYPNDNLSNQRAYDFGAAYRGGLFITGHGSWHMLDAGGYATPPVVAYFPMDGGAPSTPVNFSDPTVQWTQFVYGFQNMANSSMRYGRPTGIAVGPKGTLFIADDDNTQIYFMRPR
jgi:glucose/arabinose dehydrogenase